MRYHVDSTRLDSRVFQKENVTERASGKKEPRKKPNMFVLGSHIVHLTATWPVFHSLFQVHKKADQINSDKFPLAEA